MIPSTTPPPTARAIDTIVATDRAVPGPDQHIDRTARPTEPFRLDEDREPVNRRGRRHENALERRRRRSTFRQSVRTRSLARL